MTEILAIAKAAGYGMNGVVRRIANGGKTSTAVGDGHYEVVIVGAGAEGISVAASLKSRKSDLKIVIIDPADIHYYQPGWTMVGGGMMHVYPPAHRKLRLISFAFPHWPMQQAGLMLIKRHCATRIMPTFGRLGMS